jgi:hypothetical protein
MKDAGGKKYICKWHTLGPRKELSSGAGLWLYAWKSYVIHQVAGINQSIPETSIINCKDWQRWTSVRLATCTSRHSTGPTQDTHEPSIPHWTDYVAQRGDYIPSERHPLRTAEMITRPTKDSFFASSATARRGVSSPVS